MNKDLKGNIYPVTRELDSREAVISFTFYLIIFIYVSSFWGTAASYLPSPLDRWVYLYLPVMKNWWLNNVLVSYPYIFKMRILWYLVCFIMAFLIPVMIIKITGRKIADYGIAMPNKLGLIITALSVLVSIPFGLWLVIESPYEHKVSVTYILSLLSKIPEHFAICGILIGVMVPGRVLPEPLQFSGIYGNRIQRLMRSLGLAQTGYSGTNVKFLRWLGINWSMFVAILCSSLLYWSIHWGRANYVEVYTSLPGGIAIAYLTIRTHSIWPTIIAHWTLNLVPIGILKIFG